MASPAKDVKGKGSEGRRRSSNFLDYLGNELLHVSKFTQMFTGKRDSTDGANGNKEDTGDSAFSESFTVPTPGKFRRGSSFSIARNMVDIAPTLAAANAMCTNDKYSVPEPPDLHEMLDARKLEELQLQISSKSLSKGRAKSVAMEKAKEIESIKKGKFLQEVQDEDDDDDDDEYNAVADDEQIGQIRPDARPRPLQGCHPEHKYECLVFKGGGAKGSIYPGAIRALEDAGVMPYIKRYAGASAGALVAALLAAGLTSDQLYFELATTDLHGLVLDASGKYAQAQGLFKKFGMHPGKGLYRHLGLLFHRYLGCADVTFAQLYDHFGVELAIAVTNISRAAVELLHVKTAPNYPIRKAIRMSMSLPLALHPCMDRNIHSVIHDDVKKLQKELEKSGVGMGMPKTVESDSGGFKDNVVEYYVDGGVLNNYPIDSFDGWWLSMEKDDNFFRRIVGEGGHKNYVERFGSYDEETGARAVNSKTIGFRLASVDEPDALHERMGNDALELMVRGTEAAKLPATELAIQYATRRYEMTGQSRKRYEMQNNLRASMTWIKKVRNESLADPSSPQAQKTEKDADVATAVLTAVLEKASPPPELFSVLGITDVAGLVDLLRHHHNHRQIVRDRESKRASIHAGRKTTAAELQEAIAKSKYTETQVKGIYERDDLSEDKRLLAIQSIVRVSQHGTLPSVVEACDELEELLEVKGSDVMKRLCGMEPKPIKGVMGFTSRMIEAIQMTNDERVHTKQNYSRTCMLNTEYVGTMDFKLEDGDYKFLWNKGYMSTKVWLDKRTKKAKDKKKKVAKLIATELKRQAKLIKEAAKSASFAIELSRQAKEASFRKENGSFSKEEGLAAAPAAPEEQQLTTEAGVGATQIAPNSSLQNPVDSSPAPDQVLAGQDVHNVPRTPAAAEVTTPAVARSPSLWSPPPLPMPGSKQSLLEESKEQTTAELAVQTEEVTTDEVHTQSTDEVVLASRFDEMKVQLLKVLNNECLRASEKVDIISRRLAQS